jgi:hypothetical protein
MDVLFSLGSTFAAVIAAIISAVAAAAKIRPIGRWCKQMLFKELYEADAKHDGRLDSLELRALKQTICDRRLPLAERLNAGEEYTRRGHNGEIRAIYESLKRYAEEQQLASLAAWDAQEQANRSVP